MDGLVFDIQRFCVHDGPGIRTTVFLKGCPLRCAWCHNPEGLIASPQVQFFAEACIGCKRCGGERTVESAAKCPTGALKIVGERYTVEELVHQALADRDFYGTDGGITFSGGECLLQSDFVRAVLTRCKEEGVTTAVDTCGAVEWRAFEAVLPVCDTFLYDIKCADPDLHKRFTGLDNTRILENFEKLGKTGADIWVRVPVIPDVNDDEDEMRRIASIIAKNPRVSNVTLIPYHTLGKSKYQTLGMTAPYETEKSVSDTALTVLKTLFASYQLPIE